MFEIVRMDPKPQDGQTAVSRALGLVWAVFLLGVGAFLAVLFTIAIYYEIKSGTAFGMGICLLVVAFGAMMTRDGIAKLTGFRIRLAEDND
ncbi:MAG: hypothetical protein AAGJ28_09335 [Pseudomonadota bacterium]